MFRQVVVLFVFVISVGLLPGCSNNGSDDDQEAGIESETMTNLVGASSIMPYGELDDPDPQNELYDR